MKIWPIYVVDGLWVVGEQTIGRISASAFVFRVDAERVCERRNWPNRFRVRPWTKEREFVLFGGGA